MAASSHRPTDTEISKAILHIIKCEAIKQIESNENIVLDLIPLFICRAIFCGKNMQVSYPEI